MGDFFYNLWEIWSFSAFLWILNFLFCNFRRQFWTFWRNLKNLPEFLRKLKNEKIEDNFWEIMRNIFTGGSCTCIRFYARNPHEIVNFPCIDRESCKIWRTGKILVVQHFTKIGFGTWPDCHETFWYKSYLPHR